MNHDGSNDLRLPKMRAPWTLFLSRSLRETLLLNSACFLPTCEIAVFSVRSTAQTTALSNALCVG